MVLSDIEKRDRKRERNNRYYYANAENLRALKREQRASNADKAREYDRKRYISDPNKKRESSRRHYAANIEKKRKEGRERSRKYRIEKPDRARENTRRYRAANPEVGRACEHLRRALIKTSVTVPPTASQIACIMQEPCIYCGEPSEHLDHVIPLSRGGTHDIDNLVPACARCNLSKGSKLPSIEWIGRSKITNETRAIRN